MAVKSTKAAAPAPKKAAPAKAAGKAPAAAPAKAAPPVTVTLKNLSASLAERHGMAKKQADGVLADVFDGDPSEVRRAGPDRRAGHS